MFFTHLLALRCAKASITGRHRHAQFLWDLLVVCQPWAQEPYIQGAVGRAVPPAGVIGFAWDMIEGLTQTQKPPSLAKAKHNEQMVEAILMGMLHALLSINSS